MGGRRAALRLRLAALEVLPQRRAQTPLLPDLRCALGTLIHWVKIMYRGRPTEDLGRDRRRMAHACASSGPVAMGRRTAGRFPFCRFSPAAGRCRSSVVEHPCKGRSWFNLPAAPAASTKWPRLPAMTRRQPLSASRYRYVTTSQPADPGMPETIIEPPLEAVSDAIAGQGARTNSRRLRPITRAPIGMRHTAVVVAQLRASAPTNTIAPLATANKGAPSRRYCSQSTKK